MDGEPLRTQLIEEDTVIDLAVLCDDVLIEESGALSIIRIINRMFPPDPDDTYVNKRIKLALLLVQGSGDPEISRIDLDAVAPDGTRETGNPYEFSYPDDRRSLVRFFDIDFTGTQDGTYWFELSINGRLRKRLPLQVLIPALRSESEELEADPSEYGVEPG